MRSSLKEGDVPKHCNIKRAINMKHFWMFHLDLLHSAKLSDTNTSNDRNKTLYLIMHLVYWIRIIGRLKVSCWSTLFYKISHVFKHLWWQSVCRLGAGALLTHTTVDKAVLGGVIVLHNIIVAASLVENDFTFFFVITNRSMKAIIDKQKKNVRLRAIKDSIIQWFSDYILNYQTSAEWEISETVT